MQLRGGTLKQSSYPNKVSVWVITEFEPVNFLVKRFSRFKLTKGLTKEEPVVQVTLYRLAATVDVHEGTV
jgi:hypothetical protein